MFRKLVPDWTTASIIVAAFVIAIVALELALRP